MYGAGLHSTAQHSTMTVVLHVLPEQKLCFTALPQRAIPSGQASSHLIKHASSSSLVLECSAVLLVLVECVCMSTGFIVQSRLTAVIASHVYDETLLDVAAHGMCVGIDGVMAGH